MKKGLRLFSIAIGTAVSCIVLLILIINSIFIWDAHKESKIYHSLKTGLSDDGKTLRIVNEGTYSLGVDPKYFISDTNIITFDGEKEGKIGFMTGTTFRRAWDFKALKKGEAKIYIDKYVCGGDWRGSEIYTVTADDDLKLTYKVRSANKLNDLKRCFKFPESTEMKLVTENGEQELDDARKMELAEKFEHIYGKETEIEKEDLDRTAPHFYLKKEYGNGNAEEKELYIVGNEVFMRFFDKVEHVCKFEVDEDSDFDGGYFEDIFKNQKGELEK